ncbi:MAG: DUF4132 domain-containing protein [Phycisphaerales bacterium]
MAEAPVPAAELDHLADVISRESGQAFQPDAAAQTPSFAQAESLAPVDQAALILVALRASRDHNHAVVPGEPWEQDQARRHRWWGMVSLANMLLNRTQPWTADGLQSLLELFTTADTWHNRSGLAKQLEAHADLVRATPRLVDLTAQVLASIHATDSDDRKIQDRLGKVLGMETPLRLVAGEAWSDRARADLEASTPQLRAAWTTLVSVCAAAAAAAPGGKWMKSAAPALKAVGHERFIETVVPWFALVEKPRTTPLARTYQHEPDPANRIIDPHMDILKGLCWVAATLQSPDLARALGRLALTSYKKVPGLGPRAVRVGNAAVYSLGEMPGMDSLGQLAMLRVKVKFGGAQKAIEKALNAAAEREGLPREEIEELGVPSYGLTAVGKLVDQLGDYRVELSVTGIGDTELLFFKADSAKPQKSVPAALKASHTDDLKDLKAAAKDIGAMLPAQRDRIDSLFLENKTWAFSVWRERYLDHPLVGVLARRLIWRIADGNGDTPRSLAWLDEANALVDVTGKPAAINADSAIVRLWHPIEVDQSEVLAWRRFFEDRQIRQPFKQAHREVYLLTDAERRTATYSNRFAAHILKQHQFHALAAARGWKNKLRLMVDDEYPPATRALPAFGLRAEYWVEGAGDEFGRDTNEAGAFLHLTTDQIRFYPQGAALPSAHAGGGGYGPRWTQAELQAGVPLEQIPPLVFSEVMRDTDLFVGVASVSNNPQWNDGGPGGAHRNYWWGSSFGELSQTGAGRRDLLSRLLPRLKIAAACSLSDRFLVVKGTLRTYKIHLGSGNILMEPNDQYLCIVPGQRDDTSSADVFLPFEGDRTLSIILSKAFLLAADDKIKDSSITQQIKRSV